MIRKLAVMKRIKKTVLINGKQYTQNVYYVKGILPVFRAIMLPYIGIVIRKSYENDSKLLRHEFIHYIQFKRMGLIMFLLRYLFQLILIGYDTMPMELEARQELKSPYFYRDKYWRH